MHTQLGSSGSAALGTAAGPQGAHAKGKMKAEPINVIAFCGDGGGADMGLGAISATLTHKEYNSLILLYDNESYANTDIQLSGMTPYGAHTTFSPPGRGQAHHPHALEEEHGGHAGRRASGVPVRRHGVRVVCRGDDEQGPQGADDRRTDLHPLARPVPEGLGLRPDALPRAGRAGGRDRHLPALRVRGRGRAVLRQDQGDRGGPASGSRSASTCSSRGASRTSPRRTSSTSRPRSTRCGRTGRSRVSCRSARRPGRSRCPRNAWRWRR